LWRRTHSKNNTIPVQASKYRFSHSDTPSHSARSASAQGACARSSCFRMPAAQAAPIGPVALQQQIGQQKTQHQLSTQAHKSGPPHRPRQRKAINRSGNPDRGRCLDPAKARNRASAGRCRKGGDRSGANQKPIGLGQSGSRWKNSSTKRHSRNARAISHNRRVDRSSIIPQSQVAIGQSRIRRPSSRLTARLVTFADHGAQHA